jgi:hypothetical protein
MNILKILSVLISSKSAWTGIRIDISGLIWIRIQRIKIGRTAEMVDKCFHPYEVDC